MGGGAFDTPPPVQGRPKKPSLNRVKKSEIKTFDKRPFTALYDLSVKNYPLK